MLIHRRGIEKQGKMLAALGAVIGMAGCDSLVSPEYLGESRLQLRVSVQNSAPADSANKQKAAEQEKIIPVLAHPLGGRVRFSSVEVRGEFPADFQVNVFGEPDAELDAFDALAPDSAVALLYLAAVPRRRLDEPAYLLPGDSISPVCWDGNCDILPGPPRTSETCADADTPCVQRDALSPAGDTGDAVTQLYQDLVGFSQDHVVMYAREPLPAKSWPALRVGAADGLPAGYHLLALTTPDEEAQQRSNECFARATSEFLEQFNAKHDSDYTPHALECLLIPFEGCGPRDAPTGAAAKELAAGIAQAEIDHDCLSIAPEFTVVKEPANETLSVRIGDLFPSLHALPAVDRELSQGADQGEGE